MALVNPNIAMSFRQPEFRPRNAMAEYAQMQQIEGGQRQAEVADMQLESLRRERDALSQIQAAIVAKGGPADLGAAADAMLKSGNPKYFAQGLAIQETLKKQALLSRYESQYGGGAPAMPSSAPGAMVAPAELAAGAQPEPMTPVPGVVSTSRVPGVVTAPITAPTGTMREIAPGGGMGAEMPLAPANALAPAAAAPVNAMVAAQPAAPASDVNALTRRYIMASRAGSPDAPVILEQIKAALKPDPSELRTMQQLGYPMTQEGYSAFRAAQMKDSAPPVSIAEFERAKRDPGFMRFLQERAAAIRPPAAPRPEPAPRTQQVTMSDGTLGIVNMDTGVITPSTVDGVPAKGKANKDLAVSEQQASYNLGRILDAAKEINAALKKDPNALKPGMGEASAASVGLSGTANVVRSAQRQIVYGAQRDALDAMLYLATGAAYNKEQLEGQMAAYVPAFTDKPDAVEAKRVRMLGLIQNAKVRAGKAWTPEMDAASQALLLPVASSAKPAGGNKPPAAPGASNLTQERADANATIAAGAPVDAVRARFKERTGQEL